MMAGNKSFCARVSLPGFVMAVMTLGAIPYIQYVMFSRAVRTELEAKVERLEREHMHDARRMKQMEETVVKAQARLKVSERSTGEQESRYQALEQLMQQLQLRHDTCVADRNAMVKELDTTTKKLDAVHSLELAVQQRTRERDKAIDKGGSLEAEVARLNIGLNEQALEQKTRLEVMRKEFELEQKDAGKERRLVAKWKRRSQQCMLKVERVSSVKQRFRELAVRARRALHKLLAGQDAALAAGVLKAAGITPGEEELLEPAESAEEDEEEEDQEDVERLDAEVAAHSQKGGGAMKGGAQGKKKNGKEDPRKKQPKLVKGPKIARQEDEEEAAQEEGEEGEEDGKGESEQEHARGERRGAAKVAGKQAGRERVESELEEGDDGGESEEEAEIEETEAESVVADAEEAEEEEAEEEEGAKGKRSGRVKQRRAGGGPGTVQRRVVGASLGTVQRRGGPGTVQRRAGGGPARSAVTAVVEAGPAQCSRLLQWLVCQVQPVQGAARHNVSRQGGSGTEAEALLCRRRARQQCSAVQGRARHQQPQEAGLAQQPGSSGEAGLGHSAAPVQGGGSGTVATVQWACGVRSSQCSAVQVGRPRHSAAPCRGGPGTRAAPQEAGPGTVQRRQ
ncbi:hypothetical protein CYMTET_56875 [Cymbomonas tetramitiformis]|uniref:Uncharacterized protein n=1 Tax=Cymbomonas tetramitiformis TaxID=36881 RepID=A0AAE0BBG2_9CHLO|nr:hypothetical protein CYMTET_56875 [Cymbomonas tetramitiformis]